MIKVLYEDNHLLVVEKPVNVPMQADSSGDIDLQSMAKAYLKEKYQKPGEVFCAMVHRLDRPVGGVCVFARTSKSAARLSESIRQRRFYKTYHAVVENPVLEDEGKWVDKLWKDEKKNMVFVSSRGKESSLSYRVLKRSEQYAWVEIHLHTGRPHQIRVQFSSRNHALYGDQRYNAKAKVGQQIALWAYSLRFEHPVRKEMMSFVADVKRYPFVDKEEIE